MSFYGGPGEVWEEVTNFDSGTGGKRKPFVFLGPFSLEDLTRAARLSKGALTLWLLTHHQCRLSGQAVVTLPTKLLIMFGIDRQAKYRALKALVEAGLLHVLPTEPGQSLRIAVGPAPAQRKKTAKAPGRKRSANPYM